MGINKTIHFTRKTLEGITQEDTIGLNLSLPSYCESELEKNKANYLIYRSFQTQRTNKHQGTSSTKTRAEVRGGGRKPWRQKGTGRARAGSNRSPLWKGGGVSFGPKPKNYSKKINRKEWRLSLRLLFFQKQENIVVVDRFDLKSVKTKELLKNIGKLDKNPTEKILIIVEKIEKNLKYASQNLKNVQILPANCLNINDVLLAKSIILTEKSLKIIEETYKNV